MRRAIVLRKAWKLLRIAVVAALAIGAIGFVIMSLWNWLAPATFGGHLIGFWQAIGLFTLVRLLLGGFRGHGHRGHWRHMARRWSHMSEEERERFRHGCARRYDATRGSEEGQPA